MRLHCVYHLVVKADRAIELALAEWNKETPNQKQGWFNERRATQNSSMNVICGKSWITK